jgi:hypothetical protein
MRYFFLVGANKCHFRFATLFGFVLVYASFLSNYQTVIKSGANINCEFCIKNQIQASKAKIAGYITISIYVTPKKIDFGSWPLYFTPYTQTQKGKQY